MKNVRHQFQRRNALARVEQTSASLMIAMRFPTGDRRFKNGCPKQRSTTGEMELQYIAVAERFQSIGLKFFTTTFPRGVLTGRHGGPREATGGATRFPLMMMWTFSAELVCRIWRVFFDDPPLGKKKKKKSPPGFFFLWRAGRVGPCVFEVAIRHRGWPVWQTKPTPSGGDNWRKLSVGNSHAETS